MSGTLSHPFRIDGTGAIATAAEGSARQAAELAGHVAATVLGERPLAPDYGMPDLAGAEVNPALVAALITQCEPELNVDGVDVVLSPAGVLNLHIDVSWADGQ